MIRRLIISPIAAMMLSTAFSGTALAQGSLDPLVMPEAPMPNPDQVVVPPSENQYFPMRSDGQPVMVNVDLTNNFTDLLTRFYFNPHWRGYQWSPYPLWWVPERVSRTMVLWTDYDEQNIYGIGNRWCKFIEKYSGYGPGPPGGPQVR